MSQTFDTDFQKLCDLLESAYTNSVDPGALQDELEDRLDDLKKLLDVPPKSDASRQKLNAEKLEVDGQVYKINTIFAQEAAQLSDDFNLDEVAAAKLLLKGTEQQEELDRPPMQCASFIFHTRRKNILDAIRLILSYISEETSDGQLDQRPYRRIFDIAADKLIAPTPGQPSFTSQCLTAMESVRNSVRQLHEKERHAQTLQYTLEQNVRDDMELQLRFLRNQHELLSNIVYYLVRTKTADLTEFRRLLGVLRNVERSDSFMVHAVLPLAAYISRLCGSQSPITFDQAFALHKEIMKDYTENPWKTRSLQAGMLVWWLTEFNGLCNDEPSVTDGDFIRDISNPIKTAFKDGGMEFLMALASDVCSPVPLNAAKEDLVRYLQQRVPPIDDTASLLPSFKELLISQLEEFVDSFISNMAEILKDIKLTEEEDHLMGQRNIDFELERFFLLIHFAFYDRPSAGKTFWDDIEGQHYGFLTFAAAQHTPLMTATFSYMLASISQSQDCADQCHKFLLAETSPGANRNRREPLTWDLMFRKLAAYIQELQQIRDQINPKPGYNKPAPTAPEKGEPDAALTLSIDGYLRVMGQAAVCSRTAREWLLTEDGYGNSRILYYISELLELQTSSALLDSIFSTLAALLTEKTTALSHRIWGLVDNWVNGLPSERNIGQSTALTTLNGNNRNSSQDKFDMIISSVHPAEAFARLLCALVAPAIDSGDLKDSLPFNENFGGAYRLPGMEQYTDFVLETVFSNSSAANLAPDLAVNPDRQETPKEQLTRVHYRRFRPALQLACLQFIYICLSSFNENLLTMAHRNLAVDKAMATSSLETYTKLHPFGRVMEEILTDKVLGVFYEILSMGSDSLLGHTEPPQPAVETILYAIKILDLTIHMQPTYTRVVKPFIEKISHRRKRPNGGVVGLEKAVANNLKTIVDLGLFVGAKQPDIVLASISLLEKFNICEDLVSDATANKNRILTAIEQSEDSRRIIFNFLNQWNRDLGDEEPLGLKMPILRFLERTLKAQPLQFSLAHFILGFGYDPREGMSLSTDVGGIGSGTSMFHNIMDGTDTVEYDGDRNISRQVCEYKNACYSILHELWKSPFTSSETMYVLHANKFFFTRFMQEEPIMQDTLWAGSVVEPTLKFFNNGSYAYIDFLGRRTSLLEYMALEIRHLSLVKATSATQNCLSTLLGLTQEFGDPIKHMHVLDLLDFLEYSFPDSIGPPTIRYFTEVSREAFRETSPTGITTFDIDLCAEYLELKKNQLLKDAQISAEDLDALTTEKKQILATLFAENQLSACRRARYNCLKAWSVLIRVTLEECEMERMAKTQFILMALQTILPRLETYSTEDIESAECLSNLAHSLIFHTEFDFETIGSGKLGDQAGDRLYQLFRASMRCIQSPLATPTFRENLYNIALRYLNGMSEILVKTGPNTRGGNGRRHSTQMIRGSGDRLLEVICNDAYSGEGSCKVVALLLLTALAGLAAEDNSTYIIDVLVRQNFLVVLLDSIKNIGDDLCQAINAESRESAILAFRASTNLLNRLSETKPGATAVANSGFIDTLNNCQLFQCDPDLGFAYGPPDAASQQQALNVYYDLILHLVRVLATMVLARGPQNRETMSAAEQFVIEKRGVAVCVFKKHAGVAGKGYEEGALRELTEVWVLLMSLTAVEA